MATLAEIRAEIVRIIQDESYSSTVIDRMINQSIKDICGGVPIIWPEGDQTLSWPMDELYTIGSKNTTANAYLTLPSDYQRNVAFVSSTYTVKIYDTFGEFRRNFPALDMTGSVVAAAVKGNRLYYQGIPSSATALTIHYYKNPSTVSADNDVPDGIPARFHMTLIVYDVSLKIFQEIYEEDAEQHAVLGIYEKKRMDELIALDSLTPRDEGSVIFKCR